jgi:hypothetical protein
MNGFRVTGVLTWLLLGPGTVNKPLFGVCFVMLSVNVMSPSAVEMLTFEHRLSCSKWYVCRPLLSVLLSTSPLATV